MSKQNTVIFSVILATECPISDFNQKLIYFYIAVKLIIINFIIR